jgi:hypothetical protein
MLNSKEKAKELIHKFYIYADGTAMGAFRREVAWSNASQCALIAVQELINETTCLWKIIGDDLITYPEFWISVKEEIENY